MNTNQIKTLKLQLPDFASITFEDLQQNYEELFENCNYLKNLQDHSNQQIYELKRNLTTSKAGEAHLNEELELITTSHEQEIQHILSKHTDEIEQLKLKLNDKNELNNNLEQNLLILKQENLELQNKLMNLTEIQVLASKELIPENDPYETENKLVKENLELLGKLDEFQQNIQKYLIIIAERDNQIEMNKEHILCLEQNLNMKTIKLEENIELLECTQSRMVEMNAELAMLKTQPENDNRKGNSLFAEVDDQRQAMKHILVAQKKNYVQMKKCYNDSEHEIRRLKRENAAMHNELKICSSIFLNAEKTYKTQLNNRIHQLLNDNETLQKKLRATEERLVNLGMNKGINWLDSMLSFCKSETRELNTQLHTCRMEKSILERDIEISEREYAKWRFEALKSRCIIIDRESLLEENKINFKKFTIKDVQLNESDIKNATPKISFGGPRLLLDLFNQNSELQTNVSCVQLSNENHNHSNCPTTQIKSNSPNKSLALIKNDSIINIIGGSPTHNKSLTIPENTNTENKIIVDHIYEILNDTATFHSIDHNNQEIHNYTPQSSSSSIINNSQKKVEHEMNSENSFIAEQIHMKSQIKEEQNSTMNFETYENNNFDIYEDTTETENILLLKTEENKENSIEFITPNKNKTTRNSINHHSMRNNLNNETSISNLISILVKTDDHNIQNDINDFKYVKFDENTIIKKKSNTGSAKKSVTKRTRSNIVIKKLEIQPTKE